MSMPASPRGGEGVYAVKERGARGAGPGGAHRQWLPSSYARSAPVSGGNPDAGVAPALVASIALGMKHAWDILIETSMSRYTLKLALHLLYPCRGSSCATMQQTGHLCRGFTNGR